MAAYLKVMQAIEMMAKDPMAMPDLDTVGMTEEELTTYQAEARRNGLPALMPVTNSGALRKTAIRILGCFDSEDKRTDEEIIAAMSAWVEKLGPLMGVLGK